MNYEFLKKRRTAPDLRNQRKIRRSWKYWKKKLEKKEKKKIRGKTKRTDRVVASLVGSGPWVLSSQSTFIGPDLLPGFSRCPYRVWTGGTGFFPMFFFVLPSFTLVLACQWLKETQWREYLKVRKKKRTSTWKPNNWLAMAARWGGGGGGVSCGAGHIMNDSSN